MPTSHALPEDGDVQVRINDVRFIFPESALRVWSVATVFRGRTTPWKIKQNISKLCTIEHGSASTAQRSLDSILRSRPPKKFLDSKVNCYNENIFSHQVLTLFFIDFPPSSIYGHQKQPEKILTPPPPLWTSPDFFRSELNEPLPYPFLWKMTILE